MNNNISNEKNQSDKHPYDSVSGNLSLDSYSATSEKTSKKSKPLKDISGI